jgi:hypothetical protein
MSKKMKTASITRGYRLKPETHRLIKAVKENLGFSHDKILNDALKSYYFEPKRLNKTTKHL